MALRRHPDAVLLAAWFDGESPAGVGRHVTQCRRCHGYLTELAEVRAWLRAQPFFAMHDDGGPPPAPSSELGFARLFASLPRRRWRYRLPGMGDTPEPA